MRTPPINHHFPYLPESRAEEAAEALDQYLTIVLQIAERLQTRDKLTSRERRRTVEGRSNITNEAETDV